MYRHFAVVTLAATVLMAIFSDGEKQQAVTDEIASQQAAAKAHRDALAQKFGTPQLVQADGGSYESGTSGDYGAPMDWAGSQVQNVGNLNFSREKCAKGHLVQQARSSEDAGGRMTGKCVGEETPGRTGPAAPTANQQAINALVTASLRDASVEAERNQAPAPGTAHMP